MIPRLFENDATDFDSYGMCPLTDSISCAVTEVRRGEYILEMGYPRDGQFADLIAIDRIILADPADDKRSQPFRIKEVSYDMNGDIVIQAEHDRYRMNHMIVGANNNTIGTNDPAGFWNVMTSHLLSTPNPFTFWTDVSGGAVRTFGCDEPTPLGTMLGGTEGSMIDLFGGELEFDRYTVKLWQNRGSDNGVKIAYTKNLTGLEYDIDMSDVFTGVVAFYKDQDNYVESDLQTVTSPYGYSHDIVVDASNDFEDTPTKAQLNTYASNYLASHQGTPSVSVEVEFVPLWQTDEYKDFYGLEHVSLCDTVEVVYPPLNLDLKAKVVKTVYNVLADRYDEITISTIKPTLADTIFSLMEETKK